MSSWECLRYLWSPGREINWNFWIILEKNYELVHAELYTIFFYKNIFYSILWDISNPKDSCKKIQSIIEHYCNNIQGDGT